MTSTKSFLNIKKSISRDMLLKASVMPILAFLVMLTSIFDQYSFDYGWEFYNSWFYDIFGPGLPVVAFLCAGLINAYIAFGFAMSKKRSNVILSLGAKRNDIYYSRFFAGLIPMVISVAVATLLLAACMLANGGKEFVLNTFIVGLSAFSVYLLSYTVASVVFANSGNAVEGVIYIGMIYSIPISLSLMHINMLDSLVFGADAWNGDTILEMNTVAQMYVFGSNESASKGFMWAAIDIIISIIVLLIGARAFKKHKFEIAGTFAKNRVLPEIGGCALFFATAGFFGFDAVFDVVFAIVAYIIFKLVFSVKRLKTLKSSVKYIVIYGAVYCAAVLVFYNGFFGYSSYIPELNEIDKVNVFYSTEKISSVAGDYPVVESSFLGMTNAQCVNGDEIKAITKLHEKIISDGRLKDDDINTRGLELRIEYIREDGSTVCRHYKNISDETLLYYLDVIDTEEYRDQAVSHLEKIDGQDSPDVDYFWYQDDVYFRNKGYNSNELISKGGLDKEFAQAIVEDLKTVTAQQWFNHKPEDEYGVIYTDKLLTNINYLSYQRDKRGNVYYIGGGCCEYMEDGAEIEDNSSKVLSSKNSIVVTKYMKNTVKYLTEKGIKLSSEIDYNNVKSVKLATNKELFNNEKYSAFYPVFYSSYIGDKKLKVGASVYTGFDEMDKSITDSREIEKIMKNAKILGYYKNTEKLAEVIFKDGSRATYCINN